MEEQKYKPLANDDFLKAEITIRVCPVCNYSWLDLNTYSCEVCECTVSKEINTFGFVLAALKTCKGG